MTEVQTWQRQLIIDLFDPIIQQRWGYAAQICTGCWKRIQIKSMFSLFLKLTLAFLYTMHINKRGDQFRTVFLFREQRKKFVLPVPTAKIRIHESKCFGEPCWEQGGSSSSRAWWMLYHLKSQNRPSRGRKGWLFVCICANDMMLQHRAGDGCGPRMTRLKHRWCLPSPMAPALSWEPHSGGALGRQTKWPNLGENTDKMSKSR